MALSQTITTVHGLVAQDAYRRVESLELVAKDTMRFSVRSYADASRPFADEVSHTAPYDIAGENPIRQAYLHLKSLPEFESATDC